MEQWFQISFSHFEYFFFSNKSKRMAKLFSSCYLSQRVCFAECVSSLAPGCHMAKQVRLSVWVVLADRHCFPGLFINSTSSKMFQKMTRE